MKLVFVTGGVVSSPGKRLMAAPLGTLLENGIAIGVVQVDYDSVGVDVPEDIKRVELMLSRL